MYTPPHFRSADSWKQLLRRHAFGMLISVEADELSTTHLPYLVSENGRQLRMHMARANPHWKLIERQPRCHFVVRGEHAYISPAWYQTPASVPTWNYEAVELKGLAALSFDEQELWQLVRDLTDRFEEPESPWRIDALPAEFRRPRLRSIVGITLSVEHGEAKQKLSQNRSDAERRRVAEELRRRGDERLADAMDALLAE
jgi:transcriptional regulator